MWGSEDLSLGFIMNQGLLGSRPRPKTITENLRVFGSSRPASDNAAYSKDVRENEA
jgi:hypothetical protein